MPGAAQRALRFIPYAMYRWQSAVFSFFFTPHRGGTVRFLHLFYAVFALYRGGVSGFSSLQRLRKDITDNVTDHFRHTCKAVVVRMYSINAPVITEPCEKVDAVNEIHVTVA